MLIVFYVFQQPQIERARTDFGSDNKQNEKVR